MNNAFICCLGVEAQEITLRFTGEAATQVAQTLWHHSQRIVKDGDDAILFTVTVADPDEVIQWGRQFYGEVCEARRQVSEPYGTRQDN